MAVKHRLLEEQMKYDWKQWRCGLYGMQQVNILRDKKRSDEIGSQLGMWTLDRHKHERKKSWLEHLQRIPSERAPKQLLYYQLKGRRDAGRPRRRLLDI
jgi:hypothetical protein